MYIVPLAIHVHVYSMSEDWNLILYHYVDVLYCNISVSQSCLSSFFHAITMCTCTICICMSAWQQDVMSPHLVSFPIPRSGIERRRCLPNTNNLQNSIKSLLYLATYPFTSVMHLFQCQLKISATCIYMARIGRSPPTNDSLAFKTTCTFEANIGD